MSTVASAEPQPLVTRRAVAPIATGAAALVMTGLVYANDPTQRSFLPPCPLHATTGLWCPGCGMTRATHALLHLDFRAMMGFNILAPAILAGLVLSWISWLKVSMNRPPLSWPARLPETTWYVLGGIAVLFAVARNLPQFSALAP